MLKYGIISEINYEKGLAKVHFDELDIVTDWIGLPKNSIKENRLFEVNTQVAVIMHENGEDGEILHARSSENDLPPSWVNDNIEGIEFKDGTKITYDNSTGKLTVDAGITSELIFNCLKLTVSGDIVGTIAGVGKVSLLNHIHASNGVPPTPTP
jgi:phage baseplate assembly protein gpV